MCALHLTLKWLRFAKIWYLILFDLATTFNTVELFFLFKILTFLDWPPSLYIFFTVLLHPCLLHHYLLWKYGRLSNDPKYWIWGSSVYRWYSLLSSWKKVWIENRRAQIYIQSKFNIQNCLEWKILSFSTIMLAAWISKNSHPSPWLPLSHGRENNHDLLFL